MGGLYSCFILLVVLVYAAQASKVVHISIDEIKIEQEEPLAFSNITLDLAGSWQVTNANGSVKLQGTVPGQIQTDLLAAKIIEDPYVGYNDYNLMWILWDNWTYSRTFTLNASLTALKTIILECDGLDTISTITINGKLVGTSDNMFRKYRFDIAGLVKAGQNTITVAFISAARWAAAKAATYPYVFPQVVNIGQGNVTARNIIRKEQCSFAWDWGPCFAPQGIWKDIRIVAFPDAILAEVTPQVFPVSFPKTFAVKVDAYITAAATQTATVTATITALNAQGASSSVQLNVGENFVTFNVSVTNPTLWYPKGYGGQTLYYITVSLNIGNNTVSSITKRIGFRMFELVEDPLPNGRSFYFRVNSIPVFAKGANWIPADSFEARSTVEVIHNLLTSSAEANMNVIRNWGGGIYQHDYFYDLADELGLMVWQEFMFACATYPRDQPFLDTVYDEIRYQVRRLAHHASIILWSGSNENEAQLNPPGGGWYPESSANPYLYVADYAKLYFDTVYPALLSADTSRPFVPSSPSNGLLSTDPIIGRWGDPYSNYYGDTHFYNYEFDCTNVSLLPTPRFASEFGFQSHPSIFSWLKVVNASELSWNSSIVFHRQHHPDGNQQLIDMLLRYFKLPSSMNQSGFQDFVYLTQVVQALCIKSEAEHYRRLKGDPSINTMGSIYWQLNDIWQAPTWSGLEYGGRWKLLHYYAKNFYAPILVSSYENPVDSYNVYITSDIPQSLSFELVVNLMDYNGKTLKSWPCKSLNIDSLGSTHVYNTSIKAMLADGGCKARTACFVTIELYNAFGMQVANNVFYLSTLNNVELPNPKISFSAFHEYSNTVSFIATSDQVAPYTFFQTPLLGTFNDNGLLLLPGVPVNLTFAGWGSINASAFASSLSAKSIANTYQ